MTKPDRAPDGRRCRILHLEDSSIDAELVVEHLSLGGIAPEIERVDTPRAYLDALDRGPYDVILADYSVPGFDGLWALAVARDRAPLTPFIFVSGTLGEEVAVEALRQGATDYVLKQRLGRLASAVDRAIAEARGKAERQAAAAALRESEARLRFALEAGGLGFWELDLATGELILSEGCRLNAGRSTGNISTIEALLAATHPEDRGRVQAALARAMETGDYAAEYRVVWPDGSMHWIDVRGRIAYGDNGAPLRMIGISSEVTERKSMEERQLLLMREVDHRAKNALAVVLAALRLTPKSDAEAYARAVEGRVASLARAHSLLADDHWAGAELRVLLESELAAFSGRCARTGEPRTRLDGPPLILAPTAAQALSMAMHELATNAAKYGALSAPDGRVAVTWREDGATDRLRLRWAESGGPPVVSRPTRRGFGSRVLEATLRDQLGGAVARRWKTSGLVCDIDVPLARWVTVAHQARGAKQN